MMYSRFIKIWALLFLVLILSNQGRIIITKAEEKDFVVDDPYQYFSESDKERIENEVKKLPEIYKIIVLPSGKEGIDLEAKTMFQQRNFSQDTIMILIFTDQKEIFAVTGEALQKKGLDAAFFKTEIEQYFVPNVKAGSVPLALINLTKGISQDFSKYLVEKKDSPKIPETPIKLIAEEDHSSTNNVNQIVWIVGLFILIVIFWIVKHLKRKK